MSGRFRCWQFLPPGLGADGVSGLRITPQGGIATVEEEASIRQAIQLLLSTVPGERVMRPDYGCHLERLLFEPNDHTSAGLAIHYVRQALQRWEPRIENLNVDAHPSLDHFDCLEIEISYNVVKTQRRETINLLFNLTPRD